MGAQRYFLTNSSSCMATPVVLIAFQKISSSTNAGAQAKMAPQAAPSARPTWQRLAALRPVLTRLAWTKTVSTRDMSTLQSHPMPI